MHRAPFTVSIHEGTSSHPVVLIHHESEKRPWSDVISLCGDLLRVDPGRFLRSVVVEMGENFDLQTGSMVLLRVTSFGTEVSFERKKIDVAPSEKAKVFVGEQGFELQDFDADMSRDSRIHDLKRARLSPHISLCCRGDEAGSDPREAHLGVPTACGKAYVEILRIIEPGKPTCFLSMSDIADNPTSLMGTSVWIQGLVAGLDMRSRFRI